MTDHQKPMLGIFVHGFTGGSETWKNASGLTFKTLLAADPEINQQFDFVEFDYFTKVASIFHTNLLQKAAGLLGLGQSTVRYNRPINKLALELQTFIQLNADAYEGIVLIGHSMGGLICKEVVLSQVAGEAPSIIGYVSVAVPHKGSLNAMLLSGINVNSKELTPLNEYNDQLNNRWIDHKSSLPESLYLVAQHDQYVPSTSALPFNTKSFTLPHDHNTISKPVGPSDGSFKALQKFIKKIAKAKTMEVALNVSYDEATPEYDKEIFVIKMILSEIGPKGIDDAKESFFNAEIITKAADDSDKEMLRELRSKVISLYRQTYNYYSTTDNTPNVVFAHVHEKLLSEDKKSLEVGARYVNFLHKKGLLHQVANKFCNTVVWSDDTDLNAVHRMTQ